MAVKKKTIFSWSSGKDSALAFYHLQKNNDFELSHLITTVNAHYDRVSMHGLRRELLEKQLASVGLPYSTIELPIAPSMSEYEDRMNTVLRQLKSKSHTHVAFGDIFLEDLRNYREQELAKQNLRAYFPLWNRDTTDLMHEFLSLGFKAIVVAINANLMDASFVGRVIDKQFLRDLPATVDPCGENGEFHTFCFDGPIFQYPIKFTLGDIVQKVYDNPDQDNNPDNAKKMAFLFCDLVP